MKFYRFDVQNILDWLQYDTPKQSLQENTFEIERMVIMLRVKTFIRIELYCI